jgi:hypothetical protein
MSIVLFMEQCILDAVTHLSVHDVGFATSDIVEEYVY